MRRALLRENLFRLLYLSNFHEEQDIKVQVERYLTKMETLDDVEELKDLCLETLKEPISEDEKRFIQERLVDIFQKQGDIDADINKVAVKWTTDRMSKVDLTILRLAYYEMKNDHSVPELVAVDQAVELAKKYGTDDSPKFVNGVLANFIKS